MKEIIVKEKKDVNLVNNFDIKKDYHILNLRWNWNVELVRLEKKDYTKEEWKKIKEMFSPWSYEIVNNEILNYFKKHNEYIKNIKLDEYDANIVEIEFKEPLMSCINNIWQDYIISEISNIESKLSYETVYLGNGENEDEYWDNWYFLPDRIVIYISETNFIS